MSYGSILHTWTLTHSWWQLWLVSSSGFASIYFGLAFLAILMIRFILPRVRVGEVIDQRPLYPHQIRDEILHSLVSIAIFGLYSVLTVYLDRISWLHIHWEVNWLRLPVDLLVFGLWNEVHFYLCHRLLHTRWFYARVHKVHHKSVVPTPFSTYSFHWFESILLGSVMITGMVFYVFTIPALILAPLESLILNTLGHWNYDPFPEKPLENLLAASRRHSLHHGRVTGNFGFMLPYLDAWFNTEVKGPPVQTAT